MAHQFKLSYKFLLFYALPVLLSAVSAIAVYKTVERVTQLSEITQAEEKAAQSMTDLVYGLSRMVRNVRGQALFPQDASYLQSYNDGLLIFQKKADFLKTVVQEPKQRQRLLNIVDEGAQQQQVAQKVFDLLKRQKTEAAIAQVPLMRMSEVDRNYSEFQAGQEQALATHAQQLRHSLFNLKLLVLVSTSMGATVAGLLGYLIRKRLKQAQQLHYQSQELSQKNEQLQQAQIELIKSFRELEKAQSQLVQTEKMSSLGQLVAGVAHEINNPVNFIHGNLTYVREYTDDLMRLVGCYQTIYTNPSLEVQTVAEDIELDFLKDDLPKMLDSMRVGTERIRHIVLSLRNFSRMDEADFKAVDIHEGLDSTLLILQHRLKAKPACPEIKVLRDYGQLPLVECYAGQLNQVFMNILANAIDALEEYSAQRTYTDVQANPCQITVRTAVVDSDWVSVTIADNGSGIPTNVQQRIFDPFFTTKPIGKGTGMGMSISYQIITEKHNGQLECVSTPGNGAEFVIRIPKKQKTSVAVQT